MGGELRGAAAQSLRMTSPMAWLHVCRKRSEATFKSQLLKLTILHSGAMHRPENMYYVVTLEWKSDGPTMLPSSGVGV